MPEPVQFDRSDAAVAAAYFIWGNPEAHPDRTGTIPDHNVVVTIPATPDFPEPHRVPLGEVLHSFLDPANPGAGELTTQMLVSAGAPIRNLGELGWHIHPGVLNFTQYANWAKPADSAESNKIHRLFEEDRATSGHMPVETNEADNRKRKDEDREPKWSIEARVHMRKNRGGAMKLGPAAIWAVIDNEIPIYRGKNYLQIHPDVPRDSKIAKQKRGDENALHSRPIQIGDNARRTRAKSCL